jgi:arylsulfatase A-like enzyme
MSNQPDRRAFLRSAGLGAASLALAPLAGGARRRPNILILFTDDQRFSTVNALNNPEVRTPNMDRLVRGGTSFTHSCIMGGSIGAVCAPSRAMLMTGQTLWHVNDSIVQPRRAAGRRVKPFIMFPEYLRKNGYAPSARASGTTALTISRAASTAGRTFSSAA